ncbi:MULTISPECIES: AI-2E family transporter [unclassified Dysgonomonas]|uniref:AI-2E family transporter n=1 Tax=unclassified Dysgonomonas TaxID=2630389 RepID=UPI0013EDFD8F|nr:MULTISPECIES: AI-2E family transporter [unclassified Dysgonomonas]
MTIKEKYWRYSLVILIIILGFLIFRESLPFLSGFLGAFTVYILVRKQMMRLTEKRKWRKSLAAIVILGEVLLCFLVPAFVAIWLIINQLQSIHLDPAAFIASIQQFVDLIHTKTGYNLLASDNISTMASFITSAGQMVVGQISTFVINAVVMLFLLYFMLIGGRQMESYLYDVMPFEEKDRGRVLGEMKMMVTSNAIGIPLLAVIQGAIAGIGYFIFGAPNPVLFAFLTCFATIIPLLGTALVWFPLAAYLAMTGDWGSAIGLAAYALIIITNIDNLIRFLLQKKMADTHPLITVFGVIIGLSLFGFWGVIFGPLLLSVFALFFNMFKEKYIDEKGKRSEKIILKEE